MKNIVPTLNLNLRPLILILLISQSCFFLSAQDEIRFTHLTLDDGLSQNSGYCFLQDSLGFMWIGTQDGLNRFNRKTGTFTRYLADPKENNSISHNMVFEIVENSEGQLLIGTFAGLDILDPEPETFTHKYAGPGGLSHNFIKELYIDKEDIVWIGTDGGGLNKFDP